MFISNLTLLREIFIQRASFFDYSWADAMEEEDRKNEVGTKGIQLMILTYKFIFCHMTVCIDALTQLILVYGIRYYKLAKCFFFCQTLQYLEELNNTK